MRQIENKQTKITGDKIKFQGDKNKEFKYKDLIEFALDVVPQGGFTPKNIRDRNRIQDALDESTSIIEIEDADYDNLEKIIRDSRWNLRDSELDTFLQSFENGDYKKEKKKSGK